jgi:hypothetical protein
MQRDKTKPEFSPDNKCYWIVLSVFALLIWTSPELQAEPYLAIQEGYKCSKCHVNMTGGGKRTDFANIYVQTRLANSFLNWRGLLPEETDEDADLEENPLKTDSTSSFFSGRLNDYIAIGGDFRSLYRYEKEPGEVTQDEFFQDQQDIYLQIDLIPNKVMFYQLMAGGGTPERFGLLKGEIVEEPYYFKMGDFYLPYGLRLQDDSAFTRSGQGFTYGTTDTGIEIGFEPGPWAIHTAVTNGASSNRNKRLTTSVAYVNDTYRVGVSYSSLKSGDEDIETRNYGIHAGAQFGRTGILFEIDEMDDETTKQQFSILELNFLIARGQNIKLSYERHDPDEDIFENARERYSLIYEPFLNQFVQVRAGYRDSDGIPQKPEDNTKFYFSELHLFF